MERKHPLAHCEDCPLFEIGKFVPSEGPAKAQLAVVGEAPGLGEVHVGRPFVGPSGQLLDKVLEHHGYTRKDVFYTNATLCRPPDNATPAQAAVHACRPRLLQELEQRGTDSVVVLGNTAAQSVLDSRVGITQLRVGPPKRSPLLPGVDVVPSWHPAYCLRNADAFPKLVTDIGKLKGVHHDWSPPDWRAYEDPDEALQVLEAVHSRTKRVTVDIEVGIEKDISFDHPSEYDLLCVGICYERGKVVVLGERALRDRRVLDRLGELLRDPEVHVSNTNDKFDGAGLFRHVGDFPWHFDVMLAHYTLDETSGGHDLGSMGIELIGAPDWKNEIKKWTKGGSYANVPRPILYKYNAYDCAVTWDLEDYLTPRIALPPKKWPYQDLPPRTLRDVHDFLVKAGDQLKFLEMNGITIDREYSDKLAIDYLDVLEEIEAELNQVVAKHSDKHYDKKGILNPRSPKQIKEFWLDLGVRAESTNELTCILLQRKFGPETPMGEFLAILLKHRRKQKLYSTYIKGIRKRMYRGRVYTTYMLHGSTSGRLTSRNPNLQNIVRDPIIKQQFRVANEDHVFVHVDYAQAEGRVMTWLAQDEYLRGILVDESRDIFNELGTGLYKDRFNPKDKDQRVRVKAYFYGLGYGREPYSIAQEYDLPVRQTEIEVAQFKHLIPGIIKWQQAVQEQVLRGEDLVTPFGRHRRFYLITDQNRKDVLNEALSYLPQSTSSDICLAALIRLRPMLRGLGWIRLTIHDALVVECPTGNVDEVVQLVQQVMLEEAAKIQTYVPFRTDVTIGKHWGEL